MGNDATISRVNCQQRIFITATGHYQRGIGQEYMLAISQPIVSRSVKEVSACFILTMTGFSFPIMWKINANKVKFFQYCRIPGVIGATDYTHKNCGPISRICLSQSQGIPLHKCAANIWYPFKQIKCKFKISWKLSWFLYLETVNN